MKKHSYLCVLILLILISSDLFASDSYIKTNNQNTISDSIILKNRNSDKRKVIKTGEKIKLWEINKDPVIGHFKSVQDDQIEIIINGKTTKIQKNKIVKIQTFSTDKLKTWGWILFSLGIAASILALIIIIGLTAMGGLNGLVLLFDLIFSVPAVTLLIIGNRLKSPKYNLFKKWKFLD